MLRNLLESGNVLEIIATFIALALVAASFFSIFFIIWGGITFILSAGSEERIKQAFQTIRYSVIGLIVTFAAFFAVAMISRLLGLPFNISFGDILDIMVQIFDSLKGA